MSTARQGATGSHLILSQACNSLRSGICGGGILGAAIIVMLTTVATDGVAQSAATTSPAWRDEWKPLARTLSELLESDYEIVSILAPSPQVRWYFLRKPGSFVKCTEQAMLRDLPPLPANVPPPPGATVSQPERPSAPPKAGSTIECAELTRTAARRGS